MINIFNNKTDKLDLEISYIDIIIKNQKLKEEQKYFFPDETDVDKDFEFKINNCNDCKFEIIDFNTNREDGEIEFKLRLTYENNKINRNVSLNGFLSNKSIIENIVESHMKININDEIIRKIKSKNKNKKIDFVNWERFFTTSEFLSIANKSFKGNKNKIIEITNDFLDNIHAEYRIEIKDIISKPIQGKIEFILYFFCGEFGIKYYELFYEYDEFKKVVI